MSLCKAKKSLLIVNPIAGKMKSKSGMFDIVDSFCENHYMTTVFTTINKGDATKIVHQYANDHDMIVCCGGDGTLNEIITGLMQMKCRTPIGYIPAGTTNDMAKTLHLPRSIKKATQAVLTGEEISHDIGDFNDSIYFSYVASFGAFTKVSYTTPQWLKNKLGYFAYIMDGIINAGDIHPYRLKVSSDYIEEEGEFVFGSVTNSTSIAGLFQLNANDVCLNDGKFEVLLIKNPQNSTELKNILFGLINQKYDQKCILFFHSNKVEFEFEKKVAWTVDGEFAGQQKEVKIIDLQNAIKFIRHY